MKSYRFVDGEFERTVEIRRSVFIATASGEIDAEGAEAFIRKIRARFPDATHNCFAYVSDREGNAYRSGDDGEPSGTAGQPILEALKKRGLTRSAIVVTRYFGGVKLGASGLTAAYSKAACAALDAADIGERALCRKVEFRANYSDFAQIEGALKKRGLSLKAEFGDLVSAAAFVPEDEVPKTLRAIASATAGRVSAEVGEPEFQ